MAVRKVNHSRRIRSKTSTTLSKVGFGNIIEFKYNAKDVYDKTPMVFVLSHTSAGAGARIRTDTKKGKILNGINISYLREYIIEQLLEETNPKKLKSWPLYDKAFRTYKISDMKRVKLIEYETLPQRKQRLKNENKL
tara:strand:- start:321 stop:731 length:411 start_codon:yes stop_codon:yes gene_type:complete